MIVDHWTPGRGCNDPQSRNHETGPSRDQADALPLGEYHEGDLTFAVRIECATCGHLMLFNAQRHRNGDAKILEREIAEDSETPLWE